MQLESLSSNVFQPLSNAAAREVLGGLAAGGDAAAALPVYKYTGPCGVRIGGELVVIDDYE